MKRILGSTLLALALVSLAYAAWLTWKAPGLKPLSTSANTGTNAVTVYFIHGRAKCPTCDLMLEHTREALDDSFGDEIRAGRIRLVTIDVEKPGNEHFMADFNLFTTSVVLEGKKPRGQKQWVNLAKAWELAEDREAFKAYFIDELHRFLKEIR